MSWTSMRMVGSRVLVRLHKRRDQLGSIAIPEAFARQPESGEVVACGPRAPQELQPGTVVCFGKYNGFLVPSPVHDSESEYYVMECDYLRRGQKLPRPVNGQRYAPYLPDIYAVVEPEAGDDVTALVSSDVPKASG